MPECLLSLTTAIPIKHRVITPDLHSCKGSRWFFNMFRKVLVLHWDCYPVHPHL